MSSHFIPVCEPCFLGNEERYVNEAVSSGWVSSAGKFIDRFEQEFAEYCGVAHGVTTTNGTTALHLALRALGVAEGDEVIIPDFAMVAVLNAVLYCRAVPVFVDADPETWNIDAARIATLVTKKTKAIIVVHTYGHPVAMDEVKAVADAHRIPIVEDAAEAHGAEYGGKRAGSLGTISCFSFFANKIITTGEGGMVLTDDAALAERCRYFKNLCFPLTGPRDYVHDDLGYNYRMTNMQAALGVAQLERIDELVARRRKNAAAYNERLKGVRGLQLPAERSPATNVYWMYGLLIDRQEFGMSRDEVMGALKASGVDTRYFFKPLHSQAMLAKEGFAHVATGDFPVCQRLARDGLYLPSGSGLIGAQVERVTAAIRKLAHS